MVQKIRAAIIANLIIINFIGTIFLFKFIPPFEDSPLELNSSQRDKDEDNIMKYIDYAEGNTSSKNVSNYNEKIYEGKKLIKSEKQDYYFYTKSMIIFNLVILYFCICLLTTFYIGENECCTCCSCCENCCSHCEAPNCNCSSNVDGNGIFCICCILLVMAIFFMIYFSTKLCGKYLSRYLYLSFMACLNFLMIVLSIINIVPPNPEIKACLIISAILFIFNVLGMIIPNIKCCEGCKCKKKQKKEPEVKYLPYQSSTAESNNSIQNSFNSQNNFIENPVPIVNNLAEGCPPSSTNSNTDSVNVNVENLDNQKDLNNSDLGIPPSPIDILSSEKEANSSNKF